MPFTPGDITAVETLALDNTSTSILYYIDDNGILTSLQAGQKKGTPNKVNYNLNKFVQMFENGNKNPVRIYFIGDYNNNHSSVKYNNQLLELVNEEGGQGEWTPGALNKLGVKVTPDTGIIATLAWGTGNLKVFYNDADAKQLRVAFVGLGEARWHVEDLGATPGFT